MIALVHKQHLPSVVAIQSNVTNKTSVKCTLKY